MARLTGNVIFDRDRSAAVSSGDAGIAEVPVVLQDIDSGARLTVLTGADGSYVFENVPAGNYRIVMSYGQTGGVPSPADFTEAEPGPVPEGKNPPVTAAPSPPAGVTNLDAVTPNTRLVTVSGEDLTEQNFLEGPVIYTPIEETLDDCALISGMNLITAADHGAFGSFSQGTAANTGASAEPYPMAVPDFVYTLPDPAEYRPGAGEYTVQNLMNNSRSNTLGAWWRIADHTSGNETGRMMIVNGDNPGAVFFRDTVAVEENTAYLYTAWILNMFKVTGYPRPELGVRVLGENGQVLYRASVGAEIPVNTVAPQWKQVGAVLNSQDNHEITVEFISEGPESVGNDYAIDDISLREILLPSFLPRLEIADPAVRVGEATEYTITLHNVCQSPLTGVSFRELLPQGVSFVAGTVTVNGQPRPLADPEEGFSVPDIAGGESVAVRFQVKADFVPAQNPTENVAEFSYHYTPVAGGTPINFDVRSNVVSLEILAAPGADVSVEKTASAASVKPGDELEYTIIVSNGGPAEAEGIRLFDIVPASLENPEISADGSNFVPWEGEIDVGHLFEGQSRIYLLRGTVSWQAVLPLVNTARVTALTPDPDPDNNTSTVTVAVDSPRGQALNDIITSIALQEAALAHILNAEGEKLQKMAELNPAAEQFLAMNESARRTISSLTRLETVLQAKLKSVT